MLNVYVIGAMLTIFAAALLGVLGGGDLVAGRLTHERGIYEKIVGKELRRLFLDISPQEFVIIHIGVILASIVAAYLVSGYLVLGVIIGVPIGAVLPKVWLGKQWTARLKAIDEQVEEAMVYMANSFKANPSLPEAIADVCNSMGPPITQEFQVMLREYKLGTPLNTAIINMQKRVPSRNLQLAVSALLVGRTVGGNIPSILEDIGNVIRESYRLERVIDTQTAQGRMQAWVIGLAPAAVVTVFYALDPTLIRPLFETIPGYFIIAFAMVLNIVGVLLIRKILAIRV